MSNSHTAAKSESDSPPAFVDGNGGSITILKEGSATQPMHYRMVLPKGFGPPSECHPSQEEHFRIISGVLDLGYVNGQRVELRAGQTFTLPAGVLHRPQCLYAEPAEFEATQTPGLGSANMFRSIYTTVANHRGLSMALRMALIIERHRAELRFTLPVRIPVRLLAGVARLLGVRAD